MPWQECKPMNDRLKFIGRQLAGEKMAPLCREFGISRVTGHKIFQRYKLIRQYPMIPAPAVSTIHAALDRNGLRFTITNDCTRALAVPTPRISIHPQHGFTSCQQNPTMPIMTGLSG
jgi:hypothetical protein